MLDGLPFALVLIVLMVACSLAAIIRSIASCRAIMRAGVFVFVFMCVLFGYWLKK
jgi:hypothetical protein